MSDDRRHDDGRAFFGRRVSHKLRGGRAATVDALLPKLRVVFPPAEYHARPEPTSYGATNVNMDKQIHALDPGSLFEKPPEEVWLEIGFGGGEHLIARAQETPDIGFIGCEAYVDGVAKLLGEIERRSIENVRIHDGDAIFLIDRLAPASIGRIYLLYPDPWPKRRQRKRRFVSSERLASLARILRPGGELRFATDIDDYAAWILQRILASTDWEWKAARAGDWLTPWENWTSTRYEAKALREGRKPSYLTFRRV